MKLRLLILVIALIAFTTGHVAGSIGSVAYAIPAATRAGVLHELHLMRGYIESAGGMGYGHYQQVNALIEQFEDAPQITEEVRH